MGYLRHECLVISGEDFTEVARVHVIACQFFNEVGAGSLVGGVIQAVMNGGGAFMVAPDGSKEGWELSDDVSAARVKLIDELRHAAVDWVHLLIGGDDGKYSVLASPNSK